VETLVVPDHFSKPFRAVVREVNDGWPQGKVRLVEPTLVSRCVRPLCKTGAAIHWLQLVHGVGATRSSHAVLHDVDLFAVEPDLLQSCYRKCVEGDFACVGLGRPFQGYEWLDIPRFKHVVACWELTFSTDWMRGQPPTAMCPQMGRFPEGTFNFETTLLAQALTPAEKITTLAATKLIHFGWVIGCYRRFERTKEPFEDSIFRLLLIRLLINAFDGSDWPYRVPELDELIAGLSDPRRPVFYAKESKAQYAEFRSEMKRLLESGLFSEERMAPMKEGLEPFDRAFDWS
jgi:hypothetical protein